MLSVTALEENNCVLILIIFIKSGLKPSNLLSRIEYKLKVSNKSHIDKNEI